MKAAAAASDTKVLLGVIWRAAKKESSSSAGQQEKASSELLTHSTYSPRGERIKLRRPPVRCTSLGDPIQAEGIWQPLAKWGSKAALAGKHSVCWRHSRAEGIVNFAQFAAFYLSLPLPSCQMSLLKLYSSISCYNSLSQSQQLLLPPHAEAL